LQIKKYKQLYTYNEQEITSKMNLKTMQMGMKTHNIRLKTPKINPQSNPNKFGGEKRSKLTWRRLE